MRSIIYNNSERIRSLTHDPFQHSPKPVLKGRFVQIYIIIIEYRGIL